MKHLVIGHRGQVGAAVLEVIGDADGIDRVGCNTIRHGDYDVMHICIPYNGPDFVLTVESYQSAYLCGGGLTVIHSTVPVGISAQLRAVHSPIRGIHPKLAAGIRTFVKFFGGARAQEAADIFMRLGIRCCVTEKAETTEALKLWDTTQYGVSIVLEKSIKAYCDERGLDFDLVYTAANQSYNAGYAKLGLHTVQRPVLRDTPGKIGGHCVIPNARLLGGSVADFVLSEDALYS